MRFELVVALALTASSTLAAASQPAAGDDAPTAEDLGRRAASLWFERMNELDGTESSIEGVVDLYRDDALHITGPSSHQLGAVTFRGQDHIRWMLRRLTETYADIRYRPEVVTAREQSETLFHVSDGPWGGPAVAVAFSLAWTRREDDVRLMIPGAAFFQIDDGRIRRLRLYLASGEQAEVER